MPVSPNEELFLTAVKKIREAERDLAYLTFGPGWRQHVTPNFWLYDYETLSTCLTSCGTSLFKLLVEKKLNGGDGV